ncbi:unnamed protein product [Notodromas monacha]|uniref:Uncharacterized protein n=1 Tax=Notodromas monacha TaxID=399045 RepID=A0A7R9C249_9CRUS|nr:unnamed protein product [Notodromas monacha]CAG0925986.1 unnamed protein product [Notodromas monacha]
MGDTLDERSLHQHGNLTVKGFGKTNLACGDEASNKLELTLDGKMFSCDAPSATHRPSMLTVPRTTEDLPHEGASSFALVQHSVEDTKDEIPENVTSEECAESSLQSNKEISGNLTDQFPAENSTPSNDAEILPICVPDNTQSTDVRSSQDTAETKQGSESEGQIRQVSDSKKHLASSEDSSMGKHVVENILEVPIQVCE